MAGKPGSILVFKSKNSVIAKILYRAEKWFIRMLIDSIIMTRKVVKNISAIKDGIKRLTLIK